MRERFTTTRADHALRLAQKVIAQDFQQKPESFLRIAFLFWVEFVNETNSSISKQVRPLNSTRMSFAFNINSITFSSCL